MPTNGLVIYCGTVMLETGKERKITIDMEPFKPINKSKRSAPLFKYLFISYLYLSKSLKNLSYFLIKLFELILLSFLIIKILIQ